jgi:hypothetical protein
LDTLSARTYCGKKNNIPGGVRRNPHRVANTFKYEYFKINLALK